MSGHRRVSSAIRNYFLAGLALWVPIVVTIYVVLTILRVADGLFGKYAKGFFVGELGFYIPGLGLLATALFLIVTGFIATRIIGKRMLPAIENIVNRIPLVKSIYPPAKQVADFVFSKEKLGLNKVALVEYPSKGIYQLGFVTQEWVSEINETSKNELVGVLIPNTPYPLSGFLVFVPKDRVRLLDMSLEDSMKLIISGGVVKPNQRVK
ncbi:MAG: DUF502 domain-containing protein [Candidatus Omnitrophota bacterium]